MKRNILLTALLFTFISCSNLVQRNEIVSQHNQKSPDGKTYIVISSSSLSRAAQNVINEDTNFGPDQGDPDKLTDLVLTGKKTSAEGEAETLLTAETYAELINQQIMIEPGEWTFTLAGKLNNYLFSGTETKEIIKGEINTLRFTFKSDEQYGSLELTVVWTNTATRVVGYLYDPDDISKMIASKTASEAAFEEFEEPAETDATLTKHRTTLTFDKTSAGNKLPSGTYYLKVNFDGPENTLNLGSAAYYVTIANGLITKKTITTDLSPTYTLSYEKNGGNFTDELIQASYPYTRKSLITLPEISKPGYFFDGWYDNAEFNGNALTQFSCTTYTGDVTLYAKWRAPVLYVSGTGDDSADGLSEDTALQTLDKACEKIVTLGKSGIDWTIYIIGDVTGPSDSHKKAGERENGNDNDYERSVISSDITSSYAKSILLTGIHTEKDADGNPQDMINRGYLYNRTSYSITGNCLVIATSVPVTIKNLLITRGHASYPNPSSDAYHEKGGGLHIVEGATVTLDDGVLITKNKAEYGGAVYNAGTLTMVGTATIGNAKASSFANEYVTSTTNPCSNEYGDYGGGIYNMGTLYLGTEDKALTGGIYYSYGLSAKGGGIYNTQNGSVEMLSGTIGYNDGAASGGGVYIDSGTFTMLGGEIKGNSTGKNGGGVFVNNGAVFKFANGTISGNNANEGGGGVFICGTNSTPGKMFMYDADSAHDKIPIIGNAAAAGMPSSWTNGANQAVTGAGIHAQGLLYMGYSSESQKASLTGGIYYNYSKGTASTGNGGGINIPSVSGNYSKVFINGGTIKNNYAPNGCAIYLSNDYLTIGGSVSIPAGTGDKKQDILTYDHAINIADTLSAVTSSEPIYITPRIVSTSYSTSTVIKTTTDATISSIEEVISKFTVTPYVDSSTGKTSYWKINPSNGKVVKVTSAAFDASLDIPSFDIIVKKDSEIISSGQLLENITGSFTLTLDSVGGVAASGNNDIYCMWKVDGEQLEAPQVDGKNGMIISPGYAPAGIEYVSDKSIKITCTSSTNEPTISPGVHDIALMVYYEDNTDIFTLQIKK